jgi:hypothetical protein
MKSFQSNGNNIKVPKVNPPTTIKNIIYEDPEEEKVSISSYKKKESIKSKIYCRLEEKNDISGSMESNTNNNSNTPPKINENFNFENISDVNDDMINTQKITFKKSYEELKKANMQKINFFPKSSSPKKSFFKCCFKTQKLNNNLTKERDLLYTFSQLSYDKDNYLHKNIFNTIINSSNLNEKNEKEIDSILNLIQMLFLNEKLPNFFKEFLKIFKIQNCEWLFISTLNNISKICIELFDNENFIQLANQQKSIINITNQIFLGITYNIYLNLIGRNNEILTCEFLNGNIAQYKKEADKNLNKFIVKYYQVNKSFK